MCSRYELNASPRELARHFNLAAEPVLPNRAEVRPTDQGLVIPAVATDGMRHATLGAWGFPAPWDGKPVFNARAETLTEKRTFQPFLGNRCIVPASSFPEWKKDGKARERYNIFLGETAHDITSRLMAFAGLMSDTHYTVITCVAAPRMADVHSRMPVILPPGRIEIWLDAALDTNDALSVLVPYTSDDLQVEPDQPGPEAPGPDPQRDLFG